MKRQLGLALLLLAACRSPCGARAPDKVEQAVSAKAAVEKRTLILDDVARLTWAGGGKAVFAPSTLVEREAMAELIPKLLAGAAATPPADLAPLAPVAARADMKLEIWDLGGQTYWALLEGKRRGAGAYLFRVGVAEADAHPSILLQAPHADYDVGTGDIAVALFVDPPPGKRPRALFLNTIHRYQVEPGRRQKRPDNPADVAHNPEHLFTVATETAARTLGDVVIEQIHGFADAVEDEEGQGVPAGTEAVVSGGDRRGSSPLVTEIAAGLRAAFGSGVKKFPEDVDALGATTNVQMRAVSGQPGARFVHVELSAALRKEIRVSGGKLTELGRVLFAVR